MPLMDEYAFHPLHRLNRDLRKAAATLRPHEIRYIVDRYYQVQRDRIRAEGHGRAAAMQAEPNEFLLWSVEQATMYEHNLKAALEISAKQTVPGQWCLSIYGIGGVITAGLLAHIDITRAPHPSNIWSLAGLNPTQQWLGAEDAKKVVNEWVPATRGLDCTPYCVTVAKALGRRPDTLHALALRFSAQAKITRAVMVQTLMTWMSQAAAEMLLDELVPSSGKIDYAAYYETMSTRIGVDLATFQQVVETTMGPTKMTREALIKTVSMRPWNAKLKRLCFLIGDSFCKIHRNPKDTLYGQVYVKAKATELAKDAAGEHKALAEATLATRQISDATLRKTYEAGRLPLGRMELTARRTAVKLFLAHLHHVLYECRYGKPPAHPYILEHDPRHTHYVPPPNWQDGRLVV